MANNAANHDIAHIIIDVTIIQGRDLVAKDKNLFSRKKTSSDPYVDLYYRGKKYGRTQVIEKTLSPTWNRSFRIKIDKKGVDQALQGLTDSKNLSLRIFDEDFASSDDFMGESIVQIPFEESFEKPLTSWYRVGTGTGNLYCKKASGEIQVKVSLSAKMIIKMARGNTYPLPCKRIRVSLKWSIEYGQKIDLDTSCVGIDRYGNILMDETVYFGDLMNSNKSILHSGDAREGGMGEMIDCNLDSVSSSVRALYFIVTVATPNKTLKDVNNASVKVVDKTSNTTLCQFIPGLGADYTAMFLMRITRDRMDWSMSIIEEVASARDFGTLIPEIKGYSRDICPGIVINPRERIAILRKGEAIRVKDYGKGAPLDQNLVFGLAWDVTNGQNIDLDASAICLDSSLNELEIISFNHLRSNDGSIQHGGDEREGDEIGDDEKIFINLGRIQSNVQYLAFVINSYSGQELDDISKASCHLFNASTNVDLVRYQISNDRSLDKHTGLLMACLYRDSNEWNLRIIGQAAQGLVAAKVVNDLQRFLRNVPPPQPAFVPEPEIIVNAMPDYLPVEDEIVVNPFIPQSKAPFVPGSQPTSRAPFVPGSQPISNAPFIPGS